MAKITFVKPDTARMRGIAPRCEHQHEKSGARCKKALHHKQGHSYKLSPSKIREADAPKKIRTVSRETKLDCLAMIEDPTYRRKLLRDLRARKLRPAVECMLWYYAKGKPKELVEHSGTLSLAQELSALSPEELRQRALDVAKMLTPTVH